MTDKTTGGRASIAFKGLPRGSRDLLPPACRTRRVLTGRLIDVFERWGFDQVMTPVVEYFDVLALGMTESDRRLSVRFIEPQTGDVVALRSDVTPQIARMVGQRWGGELFSDATVRLCYAADVVRQPSGDREQTEHHQVGVELLGEADPTADAELLSLACAALREVGLTEFRLDLAHRQVSLALLDALRVDATLQAALRQLWARKDRGGVAELLRDAEAPPGAIEAATSLCDLYGPPSMLPRAKAVLARAGVDDGLTRLETVLRTLQGLDPEAHARVSIDLGEVRGFDYYTGLRLRVWARGVARPVIRGGRYDDLVHRYGPPLPATGFAVDLDALEAALAASEATVPGAESPPACLVAVAAGATRDARIEAGREAAHARGQGLRAWVQGGLEGGRARAMAEQAGARRLVHVDDGPGGDVVVRRFEHEDGRWTERSQ